MVVAKEPTERYITKIVNTDDHNIEVGWHPAHKTKYHDLESSLYNIFKDKFELFCKKQNDYGPANISKFGEAGVLVRVSDKVERLINLSKNSTTPNNESISDTWDDILLYAAIAILVRKGVWPK